MSCQSFHHAEDVGADVGELNPCRGWGCVGSLAFDSVFVLPLAFISKAKLLG